MGVRPRAVAGVGGRLIDRAFWAGRRVFLTGHTGFKGGWTALWLESLGARVTGYALAPPSQPALFEVARVGDGMTSVIGDIREPGPLTDAMRAADPEVVLHMAAQPLVLASYADPVGTFATNVMGTAHVLEAARACPSVRAIVAITTDKCYENREWPWGYREDEAMGGHDPYSASKGAAELAIAGWRRSFFSVEGGPALASARAGNVIGGGDWADNRLVPDILRAFQADEPVVIRNPLATRPWQHVLEPVGGYLLLAQRLWSDGQAVAEGWNFGPRDEDARPVQWIAERMIARWGGSARWARDPAFRPHEAGWLKLDVSKARARLGWRPRWDLDYTLGRIVDWHRAWLAGDDMRARCLDEIDTYTAALAADPDRMVA